MLVANLCDFFLTVGGVSRRITDELSDWLRKERCTFNMNAVLVKPSTMT